MRDEKQQLGVILLVTFCGFIGSSIAYPIFPPLFLLHAPHSIIPETWDMSLRAILLGVTLGAYPLGQFLGSPVLGSCSDRYGRKALLCISLLLSALGYAMSALALYYNWLWILIASRFFTGMMEGNIAIVRAMAADLSTISKFKSFGKINAYSSIVYIIGPVIGGVLADSKIVSWFSVILPFIAAGSLMLISLILAIIKLPTFAIRDNKTTITLWQRFNLIKQFHHLFKSSSDLKQLIIVSFIFTFAVDIFYEFGPVYLTGLWKMTSAQIALYNGILCLTLALGSGWLPSLLIQHYSVRQIVKTSIISTAILFAALAFYPTMIFAFILFALAGLSIAVSNTNITIEISNAADKTLQGAAMGAQLSLRMLGDACICFVGGFIVAISVTLPLLASCMIAAFAAVYYIYVFKMKFKQVEQLSS